MRIKLIIILINLFTIINTVQIEINDFIRPIIPIIIKLTGCSHSDLKKYCRDQFISIYRIVGIKLSPSRSEVFG